MGCCSVEEIVQKTMENVLLVIHRYNSNFDDGILLAPTTPLTLAFTMTSTKHKVSLEKVVVNIVRSIEN